MPSDVVNTGVSLERFIAPEKTRSFMAVKSWLFFFWSEGLLCEKLIDHRHALCGVETQRTLCAVVMEEFYLS